MTRSTDDLALLKRANPVPEADARNWAGTRNARRLFAEIESRALQATDVRKRTAGPSWRRPAITIPVFAALSLAALFIAIALPALRPESLGGASPAAAGALHHAADVARSQRALPAPGPGQYLYTKALVRVTHMYVPGGGESNFLLAQTSGVESWMSADGSGREVATPQGVTFPTDSDRAAWERAGKPNFSWNGTDHHYEPGELSVFDLSGVPTDPQELLAAIERREIQGGDDADWVTFQIIGELLHLCYRSPAHRAALYEVAANFPGVDYEGRVTDAGREGVAVSFDGGGHRQELIFDPDTAELLAERQILLQQEAGLVGPDTAPGTRIAFAGPPGTVVYLRMFLETGIVGSTETRP